MRRVATADIGQKLRTAKHDQQLAALSRMMKDRQQRLPLNPVEEAFKQVQGGIRIR